MPGLRLIEGASFDPETIRLMGEAYEQELQEIRQSAAL